MVNNEFFKDYSSFLSFRPDRYGKSTLFENEHILVGLNCLLPGQLMEKHAHVVQIRFYLVIEGEGLISVGDEKQKAGVGMVIWVPAGFTHRIENTGEGQMILLVGIAPQNAD
jgi:quercetin dioxygenase-like cupin family protein